MSPGPAPHPDCGSDSDSDPEPDPDFDPVRTWDPSPAPACKLHLGWRCGLRSALYPSSSDLITLLVPPRAGTNVMPVLAPVAVSAMAEVVAALLAARAQDANCVHGEVALTSTSSNDGGKIENKEVAARMSGAATTKIPFAVHSMSPSFTPA